MEDLDFQQKIYQKLYEMRTVLNGQQSDGMKKTQIKERAQEIVRMCD